MRRKMQIRGGHGVYEDLPPVRTSVIQCKLYWSVEMPILWLGFNQGKGVARQNRAEGRIRWSFSFSSRRHLVFAWLWLWRQWYLSGAITVLWKGVGVNNVV